MNDIINKFLLVGYKFMPEMHLRQPGFTIVLVDHSLKIKKEYESVSELEIQDIYTKMN